MQILFGEEDPYIYEYPGNGPIPGVVVTLYRIAVENTSSKTIEELVVQLEVTEPATKSPLPVPLHPMHDESGGLHPGKKRFFDVVQMSSLPGSQIEVYPTDAPVNCVLPRGQYALKLKAYGKDAPPAERSFLARVADDGKLLFDVDPVSPTFASSSEPSGMQSPASPPMDQWAGNLRQDVARGHRLGTGLNIEGGHMAFLPSSQRKAAFSFGTIFVGVMLVIALLVPKPTEFQFFVFRIVLALAAAGVAATIPGFLNVDIKPWLRAGGAIAVFVVIYFFSPAKLITEPQLSNKVQPPEFNQQPTSQITAKPPDNPKPSETKLTSTAAPPINPKKQEPQRVATGMTPTVGIMVQRGGKATPSTEFEYISNGLGAQAANIGAKPLKVRFAPSGVTLEPKDLPRELRFNGNKVTISEFTGTGFTINDHGVQGIKVSGYVLEGKKTASEQPSASGPTIHITNIAPGGFAISGGNVFNPTVNNLGPPPSGTPNVAVCVSQATAPNTRQNTTTIKLKTDVPITRPWYAFFFDGPIGAGSVAMDNHILGNSPGRATKMPNPDRSFVFQVFSIDLGTDAWSPNDQITVTIPSEKPVHLERILSGSGNEGIRENFTFPCGAAPSG